MSGLRAPIVAPQPTMPPPDVEPAPPAPSRTRRRGRLWLGLLILVGAGGAAYWANAVRQQARQAAETGVVTRTAVVSSGILERTIRLAGSTAAERYVSLITPQLRGSRSNRGQTYSGASQSSPQLNIQSNAPTSGFSSDTSSSGTTTSNATQTSLGSTASNASDALKAATSRVSSSSTSASARASSNVATSGAASAAVGSSGLGSTSGDLVSGSGGGGGGGDFMLVLQNAAKPGGQVKKGDVVAEFDRQYMLNRLDDYRASVFQADADYKKQQSIVTVTRKNHDQLVDSAKADLDKAQLDMKTLPVLSAMDAERAKLAAAEAQARHKQLLEEVPYVRTSEESQLKIAAMDLQQSKLELRRVQANADRLLVKAPIGGLVVMQTIFRGSDIAQIQAGDQLWPGQMFMQIVDPSSMVVSATVNQVDVEKLRIGLKAWVRFDAYPDLKLAAHIHSIAAITKPGGMRAAYVKDVAVILKLDQMDPRVIPDLSVSADVVLDRDAKEAPLVPLAGIFRDRPGAQPYVWIRQPAGWERREVELGSANALAVAIRRGLMAGEVVAVEPPRRETPEAPAAGAGRSGT